MAEVDSTQMPQQETPAAPAEPPRQAPVQEPATPPPGTPVADPEVAQSVDLLA